MCNFFLTFKLAAVHCRDVTVDSVNDNHHQWLYWHWQSSSLSNQVVECRNWCRICQHKSNLDFQDWKIVLNLYTNAKTVVKNLTNHFIDRHIKTQIVVMNKHKKCSLKKRQWCIICTCTLASMMTGYSQLPERSKPWLKRVFVVFALLWIASFMY